MKKNKPEATMKTGRGLTELAAELTAQAERKRDFVVSARALEMQTIDGKSQVAFDTAQQTSFFAVNDLAHDQIADKLGIPVKYYKRMREENPALLDENVNQWLQRSSSKHLLRTLDGTARAFLSDKYRPLDNYDLAEVALPELIKQGAQVKSCEVTDTRLYLKAVTEKVQFTVPIVGHVVQAGIAISNSEVGCGALSVKPLIYTLACTNGMIVENGGMRTAHVGRGLNGNDASYEFFRDETKLADDRAMWLKVRDTIANAMHQIRFEEIVNQMGEAVQDRIEGDPVVAMEVVQDRFGITDGEKNGVLLHLMQGGDLSRYGLLNAVTRYAQDVESYDRATEFERMGSRVLELPKKDWKAIATAH